MDIISLRKLAARGKVLRNIALQRSRDHKKYVIIIK
jgi:hypothetical protein